MKQKKQVQNKSIMRIFQEGAAALFIILMVGYFPLYYQDNYINMSTAKLTYFRTCAIGLLAVEIIFAIFDWMQRMKENERNKKRKTSKAKGKGKTVQEEKNRIFFGGKSIREILTGIPVHSWFAVMFFSAIIISTVFSVYPQESFLGTDGRKLGAIVYLLCIAMYVILGKFLNYSTWMNWVFVAANAVVFLLAGLNFWGIDPLHMYDNLASSDYGSFISTIGNTNACSNYACIILPAGMVLYYLADDIRFKIIYGVFLVIGFYGTYGTTADSWLLGIGVAFIALFWFSLKDHQHMGRFFEVCAIFWFSNVILKLTLMLQDVENPNHFRVRMLIYNARQSIMTNSYVLLTTGILLCILIVGIYLAQKKNVQIPYSVIKKVFFSLLAIVVVIGIILLFVVNSNVEKQWDGTFQWLNMLKITDEFGSGRGLFWKQTIEAWKQLPPLRKIFGYGVNCFHQFIYQYQAEALDVLSVRVIDPHNEILLFVSIIGIWGMIAYFGLLISTIISAAKMAKNHPAMIVGAVVLCSYIAQGMVNNPTVFITPNLFLFLGILKGIERKYREEGKEAYAGK